MNPQEILMAIDDVASDIEIKNDLVYFNGLYTVGMKIHDDSSVDIFWTTPTGREKKESFQINSQDQISDLWATFIYRWDKLATVNLK